MAAAEIRLHGALGKGERPGNVERHYQLSSKLPTASRWLGGPSTWQLWPGCQSQRLLRSNLHAPKILQEREIDLYLHGAKKISVWIA